MNKILVTALSISLLGLSGFAQTKTYDYNTPIELKGVIKLENDYPMLYLKQGIDVNKKDFYQTRAVKLRPSGRRYKAQTA